MCSGTIITGINLAGLFFGYKRVLRYLRFFQQEEYNESRYLSWVADKYAYDSSGTRVATISIILNVLTCFSLTLLTLVNLIGFVWLSTVGLKEEDPRLSGKLKLNMTARAKRIFFVAMAAHTVFSIFCGIIAAKYIPTYTLSLVVCWIFQILAFKYTYFLPVFANRILQSAEDTRQNNYIEEARTIFSRVAPYTIGITGSYGKTSTKAILGQIMELSLGATFWPPKGINTMMGITRDVRERMKTGYPYAVIETGAYGIGSIKRVCEIFPPNSAIITAVGIMHLDRFGSEENIYQAKSELARAVPSDGILVCNGDNPGARRISSENRKRINLLYGTEPQIGPLDCIGSDIKYSTEGMTFSISWRGNQYNISTPLVGEAAVSNILAGFTMACALGAEPELVVAAIGNLEPIENRLEMKKFGRVIHLRDAYNSNPVGFSAALKVLSQIPGKRKILITPGMIELGSRQEIENKEVAKQAGGVCDLVFVVGNVNRFSIVQGLKDAGMSQDNYLTFDHRDSALRHLARIQQDEDVVLIENDLPDLYEVNARF